MSDDTRAALMRRILDDPQDDGLRLVYADACEEEGDADRAEFIRIQLRIADLGRELMSDDDCGDERCPGCVERRGLRRRERDLLYQHKTAWLVQLEASGYHGITNHDDGPRLTLHLKSDWTDVGVLFRRGFIGEVRTKLETWCGGEQCPPCRGQGGRWDDESIDQWYSCHTCSGTGTTPGVGAAVVACQPVEVVRVSNRRAGVGVVVGSLRRCWEWWDADRPRNNYRGMEENTLPYSVWRLLDGRVPDGWPGCKEFDSEAAAIAAMSAALLRWAKGER